MGDFDILSVGRATGEFIDELMNVEADDGGEIEQFDHVDPALATLDVRDEGLMPTESRGNLALGQTCRLAPLHQEFGQPAMTS